MYLKEKNQLFDTALEEEKWHALDTNGFPIKQEMHSSRMRTVRSSSRFYTCLSVILFTGGGGVCPGELSAQGGVSARGCLPRGVYPSMHWGRHPPVNRMTDRQL